MTKEEAIDKIRAMKLSPGKDAELIIALHTLIPELRESEDERIRAVILKLVLGMRDEIFTTADKLVTKPKVLAWLEKQKEQKPIKMEVYEVGKGTTICGQDYKCKKDYKAGNCWYIKDAIYHCSRDGYLNDQNGISWSCTPEWFNEYIQSNTEWAEEEKTRFVSGQFLQCKLSFDGFKEGEHYWLEYIGDDMHVGRSDNILNQKFHITPRQLYTLFSQQLEENEKEQKPAEPSGKLSRQDYLYQLLIDQLITYSDYEYLTGKKPAEWSEEDEKDVAHILRVLDDCYIYGRHDLSKTDYDNLTSTLKSLRPQPKQNVNDMITPNERFFKWIYDRLVNVHKENPDVDYMISFKRRIEELSFDKPSWKPSEEQMRHLHYALIPGSAFDLNILNELYEQLNKL